VVVRVTGPASSQRMAPDAEAAAKSETRNAIGVFMGVQ
jgi:hypothetical protein